MGLIVNGVINGRTYKDETLSADEVLELFKLKETFKRLGKVIRFDLDSSKIRNVGGEILHPQEEKIMCISNGTVNGDNFEIIYFKNRVRKSNPGKDGKNVEYDYIPRKIIISGISHGVNLATDKELAVFMYLHQSCVESPIRRVDARVIYTVHDGEKKSEEAFNRNQTVLNMYKEIMEGNILDLQLKAQGLRLGSFSGKPDDAIRENTIRMELMTHFDKMRNQGKINQFIDQFNSPYSMFTGIVIEAIHRGILVQQAGKGKFEYVWGHGTALAGKVACTVPAGEVPLEGLIQYAQGNYEYFLTKIESEIKKDKSKIQLDNFADRVKAGWEIPEGKSPEEVAEMNAHEMGLDELISAALYFEVIEASRATKKIYLITKGEIDGEHILEPTDFLKWKEEFEAFLVQDEQKALLKKIRQKLQGHLINSKKQG